jgi:TolA-binding protein
MLLAAGELQAMETEDRLQFADGLYARGICDMAIEEYEAYLAASPAATNADAVYFRIGECRRSLGDPAAAGKAYDRVLATGAGSAYRFRAGLRKAELERDAGKSQEALSLAETLLAEQPPTNMAAALLYLEAEIHLAAGRESDAARSLEKLIAACPNSDLYSFALLSLADILARKPETQGRAAALYEQAAAKPATPRVGAEALFQVAELYSRQKDFRKSAEAYDKLFRLYPADRRVAESGTVAAWAFHNAGLYSEALRRCEEAEKDLARLPADEQAEWLYLKANCERQLLKNEAAVETYTRLLQNYPESPRAEAAAYERALTCFRMGRFADAVQQVKALALTPERRRDIHWLLAESHAALQHDDDAIQYYRLVADEFPQDPLASDAGYRLAHLLGKRGDHAAAAALFEKVSQKAAGELAAQALFAAAVSLSRMKKHDEAVRDWDLLIQRYPKSPLTEEATYQKGLSQVYLGRGEPALESFRELIRKCPQSRFVADARYWSGVLLMEASRWLDAETELRAAIGAAPPAELLRSSQYRLATVLQKQGKLDEAAGLLQGLLKGPDRSRFPSDLLEWLAEYRLERKEFAGALEAARALCETASEEPWRQIGWFLAGKAHLAENRVAEARDAFEKALATGARTPSAAGAALRLGDIALAQTNWTAAAEYFQRAAEAAADDSMIDIRARAYAGLGQAARGRGDAEAAARYFMSVAVLFDDPEVVPECLFEAAQAFRRLNRNAESEKAMDELRSRYPESRWAKGAEK